jgi:hypothetical protein
MKSGSVGHVGGGVGNVIANMATCARSMQGYLGVQEFDEFFELPRQARPPLFSRTKRTTSQLSSSRIKREAIERRESAKDCCS